MCPSDQIQKFSSWFAWLTKRISKKLRVGNYIRCLLSDHCMTSGFPSSTLAIVVLADPVFKASLLLEIGHLTKIAFWSLLKVHSQTDVLVKTIWKKFNGKVHILCHQSCFVALVFFTKLYVKLVVSSDFRLQRHIFKQDYRKSKPILVGLRSCRWEV